MRAPKARIDVPLTDALHFLLMAGDQSTVRLPGWPVLAQEDALEPLLAAAWAQHGRALTAEATLAGFVPWMASQRRPAGAGFDTWAAGFVSMHTY